MHKTPYIIYVFSCIILITLILVSLKYPLIGVVGASIILIIIYTTTNNDIFPLITILLLSMISTFNFGKISYFMVGSLILITIFYFIVKGREKNIYKSSNYLYFFYLWILVSFIQLFFNEKSDYSLIHFQSLILGVLIILLSNKFINSTNMLSITYKIWGFFLLATIIIGWWEVLTGSHFREV